MPLNGSASDGKKLAIEVEVSTDVETKGIVVGNLETQGIVVTTGLVIRGIVVTTGLVIRGIVVTTGLVIRGIIRGDVETEGIVVTTVELGDVETEGIVVSTIGVTFGFLTSQTVPSLSTSSFSFARYTEALTLGFETCFFDFMELRATPWG